MNERITNFLTGLKEAWVLAKPYFKSEERWGAYALLAAVIVMNLIVVGINVVLTYWNNDFFNAIQVYDSATCWALLLKPLVHLKSSPYPMPGFDVLVVAYIILATYAFYFNQMLQIKWRQWLTTHYVENWLSRRAYYIISLQHAPGTVVDNPDQRISEDLRDYTANTLALGMDFITNLVTLFSFITELYIISGPITLFGVTVPGYMLWVAVLYSAIGTGLTQLIGRKLVPLSFNQQRLEANFRYRLIRVRDNPEAIALAKSEADEHGALTESFTYVRDNFWAIMRRTMGLNFFTNGFSQIAYIFPLVVILPRYFAKKVGFGALAQIPMVFSQVQGALSWFVTNYPNLVTWRATVSRLYSFREAMDAAREAAANGPHLREPGAALEFSHLTLTLPDGRKLLNDSSLTLPPGEMITLTGPSGAGKSTLFRAIAGIWPFGDGAITQPQGRLLFLPQKPYFPLGSLKRALAYPAPEDSLTDTQAQDALRALSLETLLPRLNETENWGLILSGGEQARVQLARALIAQPDWLFLDEPTASLDPDLATKTVAALKSHLPGTTIMVISHQPLEAPRHLHLTPGALVSATLSPA
ncbi:ABC transporter ATP-binding protein/permease [Acidocella sp.]|uniref:ABC transporter ATP-binding protein/permease n=1 Tax=Acidocella sp. TaxID=50710 RepID=UPI002638B0E0|nr:ABC transporter ATP-binding protein/permease [Acidocella sp.]